MHATVTNILISIVVIAIVFLTHNPLALLGLYWLQEPSPEINLEDVLKENGLELKGRDAEESEDAEGAQMGFLAKIK